MRTQLGFEIVETSVRCDECGKHVAVREDGAGFPAAECRCGRIFDVDDLLANGAVRE